MSAHPSGDDPGRHLRVMRALGLGTDGDHLAYEDIEAYVDGGLDDIAREAVAAHAATCAACAAEVEDLAAFRASLAAPRAPGPSPRVVPMPVRTRMPRLAPWLAAAAVLVLAVTVARRTGPAVQSPAVPIPAPATAPAVERPAAEMAPPAAQEPRAQQPAAVPTARIPAPAAAPGPAPAPRLRGAVRSVAGKTFRFESGVWVDQAYDSLALLPEETVSGAARAALIAREPALAPFGALGSRVVLVHAGTVYRLEP
ncbi:MAG: zf-HC2 domain-containing protein [Vicinamibacterales bacterium]